MAKKITLDQLLASLQTLRTSDEVGQMGVLVQSMEDDDVLEYVLTGGKDDDFTPCIRPAEEDDEGNPVNVVFLCIGYEH